MSVIYAGKVWKASQQRMPWPYIKKLENEYTFIYFKLK